MNSGWISIHRKILDWEWYQDSNAFRIFLHLILLANHEEKRWQGIVIKRGQTVTSLDSIFNGLNRKHDGKLIRKTQQCTMRNIRTTLQRLVSTNELTIETTTKYSLITINNYDEYQGMTNTSTRKATNKRQTNDKQTTTNNNDNNDNNENKHTEVSAKVLKDQKSKKNAEVVLKWFNQALETNFKSTHGFEDNLTFWLTVYNDEDIKNAILAIKRGEWWAKNPSPTLLFRRKTPKGEQVDYIGSLLNGGGESSD